MEIATFNKVLYLFAHFNLLLLLGHIILLIGVWLFEINKTSDFAKNRLALLNILVNFTFLKDCRSENWDFIRIWIWVFGLLTQWFSLLFYLFLQLFQTAVNCVLNLLYQNISLIIQIFASLFILKRLLPLNFLSKS